MGFLDKAKKLAEEAQQKLDEAQKQFNARQAPGQESSEEAVEYDAHGRPVRREGSVPPPRADVPPVPPPGADAPPPMPGAWPPPEAAAPPQPPPAGDVPPLEPPAAPMAPGDT